MKKISIIHSCNSLGISEGGPPRSITQLCSPLSSLNANVTIQVFKGEQEEVLPDPAVSILRSTVEDLSGFRQKILEDREAIIIHQHGLWLPSAHAVTGVANKNDVPLVLAPRGMMEAWAMKSKRWKKFIAWWLYQRRDCRFVRAFHATSDLEADSIRRLGMKQPIIILPNGVVPPPASPEDPKACEAPKQKKTVLFLSRINPKKGLPMLLEAWAKLRPADWELVIAGNDDANHQPELEALARKLGIEDSVVFAGPLFGADKDTAYRRADLFVLPTYSENFGIVVAEALAYGVPVITTTGTPWECLQESNSGWWVEPTVEGIRMGLEDAFQCSVEQLEQMGASGKCLVADDFAWEAIAKNMREAYEWILTGGSAPDFIRLD